MWKDLISPWREVFRLAWESYKRDSIPIGAVIVDANDNTISEGRNRIYDTESLNPIAGTDMAHAEMTAMMQLKEKDHPDIRTYSLYSTMEPCPMCFCTMLMMHICNLKYAARDGHAGATELKETTEFIKKKTLHIERGNDEIEVFQIAIQTAFRCSKNQSQVDEVLEAWDTYCAKGVLLGRMLHEENYFYNAIKSEKSIEEIFDEVIGRAVIV